MNYSVCSKCKAVVPVTHVQKDGKEYLEKECASCGKTVELISNDAKKYNKKRDIMKGVDFPGCSMKCMGCDHRKPDIIFVETTNRCNMNCPICITNVPSMGFQFEPSMEYFDRIFKHYSTFDFPPSVQLFGGEPTMREDLFEIIDLARSYGLSVRVVTNGLKLADREYCDKLIASGASVLVSFDGLKKEMYQTLRGSTSCFDLKLKAMDNISKNKRGKVVLMTVVDKNFNGDDMPHFFEYCIKNSDIVRGIFFMPLTQVWSEDRLDYEPERTTQEDVENIVQETLGEKTDFVPLGSMAFQNLAKVYKVKRLPFLGVHPNCESFTLLISNGQRYVPLSSYLKKDFFAFVTDIRKLNDSVEKYAKAVKVSSFRKLLISTSLLSVLIRHVNFGKVVDAKGIKAFGRWMAILLQAVSGKKIKKVIKEKTGIKDILQLILLPFEDEYTTESDRMEMCRSCFAYIDVKTDSIKAIPVCIWEKYKNITMKDMAIKYNKEGYRKGLEEVKENVG